MMQGSDLAQQIQQRAQQFLNEQLDALKEFSGIDCGTGMIEGNQLVVKIVDRLLQTIGAEVEHIKAPELGTHVVGRLKPANAQGKLIVSAHLDTVFHKGDTASHPFHIEGDYAWGLGIADCKGGVVTSIYAIKILQELGRMPAKEIVLIFNCDEEIGSPSGRDIFQREIPGAEAVYGFEPARGKDGIITYRPGYGVGQIEVTGVSAHAFNAYQDGVSATQELANLILKVYEQNRPDEGIFYNIAPISGGVTSTIVAEHARAEVCMGFPSNRAIDVIRHDLEEFLPTQKMHAQSEVKVTFTPVSPTMERTDNVLALYDSIRQAGELLGQDIPEELALAPSDLNLYAGYGATVVDAMGPYMYEIHTVREHLRISSLPERTALFAMTLALQAYAQWLLCG